MKLYSLIKFAALTLILSAMAYAGWKPVSHSAQTSIAHHTRLADGVETHGKKPAKPA